MEYAAGEDDNLLYVAKICLQGSKISRKSVEQTTFFLLLRDGNLKDNNNRKVSLSFYYQFVS